MKRAKKKKLTKVQLKKVRVAELILHVLEMSDPEVDQMEDYAREEGYGEETISAFLIAFHNLKTRYARKISDTK